MAENRKGKRFYFSLGQLVMLGVGFTLAAVIIFLLGMVVGKGIEERKLVKKEEPLVKIPITPSAQAPASTGSAPSKDEMTFYDTLTKSPGTPPTEDPAKETKQPEKDTKTDVKEEKKVKETPSARSQKPAKAELKGDKQKPREDSRAKPQSASEKVAQRPVAERESAKPAQTAENKEAGKTWAVQVNAFPDEPSARTWVDRLKNKGYNAYIAEARNKGRTWYRVRVGRYGSREDAEKAETMLKTKENLATSFITAR